MRFAPLALAASFLLPLVPIATATAQGPGNMPACSGLYNIVRVSDVKPGMMDTFLAAVTAQKGWYKQAGTTDGIMALRVLDQQKGSYSETEALTIHTQQPGTKPPAHDAGYEAFVALFNKSSSIKSQFITCQVQ